MLMNENTMSISSYPHRFEQEFMTERDNLRETSTGNTSIYVYI